MENSKNKAKENNTVNIQVAFSTSCGFDFT